MRKIHKINWKGGEIEIDTLGCKMLPTFNLDGKNIKPLHEADWVNDTSDDFKSLPGILQNLKGEFPCVPFGINSPVEELAEEWQSSYSEYGQHKNKGRFEQTNLDFIDFKSFKNDLYFELATIKAKHNAKVIVRDLFFFLV